MVGTTATTVPAELAKATSRERRSSISPTAQFRRRHNTVGNPPLANGGRVQRAATFSGTLADARNSFKSVTDDVIHPQMDSQTDDSNWHSAPLALALVPAIGGIFFKNGSAILTDVALLCLAAVFLNWSVRLPWDWYHSAREAVVSDSREYDVPDEQPSTKIDSDSSGEILETEDTKEGEKVPTKNPPYNPEAVLKARKKLQTHESVALASCFVGPLIGALLLHAIRSQLTRPSEGLVSNYNLTIFLLAAEIRPLSHVLTLLQSRTLHLQKIVQSPYHNRETGSNGLLDVSRRLDELEINISDLFSGQALITECTDAENRTKQHTCLVDDQMQKSIQADVAALMRAVRKYEKRLTVLSLETNERFDHLEANVKDLVLKTTKMAKSSRSYPSSSISALAMCFQGLFLILWQLFSGIIIIPLHFAVWLALRPLKVLSTFRYNRTKTVNQPSRRDRLAN